MHNWPLRSGQKLCGTIPGYTTKEAVLQLIVPAQGRWFASISRVSLPADEPPTEPTESEMLAL